MDDVSPILAWASFILFTIVTVKDKSLVAAGLACYVLSQLI